MRISLQSIIIKGGQRIMYLWSHCLYHSQNCFFNIQHKKRKKYSNSITKNWKTETEHRFTSSLHLNLGYNLGINFHSTDLLLNLISQHLKKEKEIHRFSSCLLLKASPFLPSCDRRSSMHLLKILPTL